MKKTSVILLLLGIFLLGLLIPKLERGNDARNLRQLEDTLRRTAVSCYAAEGFYPPSLSYMEEHYGLSFDESRYIVHYEFHAANLMPGITVLEAMP